MVDLWHSQCYRISVGNLWLWVSHIINNMNSDWADAITCTVISRLGQRSTTLFVLAKNTPHTIRAQFSIQTADWNCWEGFFFVFYSPREAWRLVSSVTDGILGCSEPAVWDSHCTLILLSVSCNIIGWGHSRSIVTAIQFQSAGNVLVARCMFHDNDMYMACLVYRKLVV